MEDLALYCKSYRRDFIRLKRLLTSIDLYNVDQIPFYISTPRSDHELLVDVLGDGAYIWVADEDIVLANVSADFKFYKDLPGGLSQAIVKSEFWRLRLSENYVCLDSDCIFIRNFRRCDFLSLEKVPYTVLHQNKEYFQLAINRGKHKVVENLRAEAQRVQALFKRDGPEFYSAPAPFIWSARVWESLDLKYLRPNKITLWDLISPRYPETLIYGEALMKYGAIPIIAIEPLFRVYHYDWQYFIMRRFGESKKTLSKNYLGVVYQSNWNANLDFGPNPNSWASQTLKKIKRFIRYLQSYCF